MGYNINFRDVFAASDSLFDGMLLTLELTALTIALGAPLGLAIASLITYGTPKVRAFAIAYTEIVRNTPLLVQLFIIFFALPAVGIKLDVIPAAVIGLSINLGAYSAEIIRGGIESTPKIQIESGLSLGFTRLQIFRHVVLMPAIKNVFPSLASQFVLIMLATSVASQIATPELFYAASIVQSRTYRDFEVYIVIAVAYLALAILLRIVLALIHRIAFAR